MTAKKTETLTWWRRRRLTGEGKRLAADVRRGLRKLKDKVSAADQTRAGDALERFRALQKKDAPRDDRALLEAVTALDDLMDGPLVKAKKGVLRQYAESIGWAAAIALTIRFFLLEPFQIPTGSMIPTLQIHDHIFVAKCSYGIQVPFLNTYLFRWDTPERGDIVVFPFPVKSSPDYGKDFIKRIVGLPGDRIQLRDNRLFINGEPVDVQAEADVVDCEQANFARTCKCIRQQETLGELKFTTRHLRPGQNSLHCMNAPDWPLDQDEYTVPEDHVFVMGDNRDNSSDGRYWGSVPLKTVKGRAQFIWYADDVRRIFSSVH